MKDENSNKSEEITVGNDRDLGMKILKEKLRKKARLYRIQVWGSLTFVVVFIIIGLYIFLFASKLSNIQTQNDTISQLKLRAQQDSLLMSFQNFQKRSTDSLLKEMEFQNIRLQRMIYELNKKVSKQ